MLQAKLGSLGGWQAASFETDSPPCSARAPSPYLTPAPPPTPSAARRAIGSNIAAVAAAARLEPARLEQLLNSDSDLGFAPVSGEARPSVRGRGQAPCKGPRWKEHCWIERAAALPHAPAANLGPLYIRRVIQMPGGRAGAPGLPPITQRSRYTGLPARQPAGAPCLRAI
jgi:hypothetical protein